MSRTWREISRDSTPQPAGGKGSLVAQMLECSRDARLFRSTAGSQAILLSDDAVQASPDFSLELDDGAPEFSFVAVVAAAEEDDVAGLLKYCDVVALPEPLSAKRPRDMASCGQLIYRSMASTPAAFVLFRNQPADAELLSRDAPSGIGEPDNNLDSREKWFRKRHGS